MSYPSPYRAHPTQLRRAVCVIRDDEDGSLLLLHRVTPENSQWECPAAQVELGEALGVAATRAAQQELDVDVLIKRHLAVATVTDGGDDITVAWYLVRIVGGKPELRRQDVYDTFEQFDLERLHSDYDALSPDMRAFVDALDDGTITL